MTSRRFILACALAGGCGDSGQPGTGGETSGPAPELEGAMVDLVSPGLWVQQAADDDPLRDHRPDTVTCPLGVGWLVEPAGLEVNTGACTYASFTQPTLREIVPGAQISLELYHFDLLALEPATAHVAVMVGEHVLFEREVAIPGKAAVYSEEWVADFELPAGSPAVFHLHNHGQNAWTLASLQVEVEDP